MRMIVNHIYKIRLKTDGFKLCWSWDKVISAAQNLQFFAIYILLSINLPDIKTENHIQI